MKIRHVIVDGSNIATEGRDAPSLAQLDEAVSAFIEEYEPAHVTVVVDATFPNRIDRNERQTYEDAVNANELITPPAGAIGRGDAFVLQIAKRAGASILSNDSFQEFHGEYPWLFERGRLIGGKPVPHVGWVFMERAPVRGPTSRRAVSEARKVAKTAQKVAQVASEVAVAADAAAAAGNGAEPGSDKPSRRRRPTKATKAAKATMAAAEPAATEPPPGGDGQAKGGAGQGPEPYNEAMPFIEFVGEHPVGSEVEATIERFSSHGAYVMIGDARAYVPLRNLADPAPRSAKEVLRVGDTRRFVVVTIDPPLRGIDLAVPGIVDVAVARPPDLDDLGLDDLDLGAEPPEEPAEPVRKSRARKAAPKADTAAAEPVRRSRAKKAAAPAADPVPTEPVRKSRARKAPPEPAAEPAPASAETQPAAPARRSRSRKAAAGTEPSAAAGPPPDNGPAPVKKAAKRTGRTKAAVEP
ncbi:MAG TPA: S1 RNA-binding domain-containing protein [Acidimicrobiales bacterium]|nr:S1 RNA-binding domain-containing protein [Acidimicrobiales bacterium]